MRRQIEDKYHSLFDKYTIERPIDAKVIYSIIKASLKEFLKDKKNPAIYCYGGHTKMLMADFIFELKDVKLIVDNYCAKENVSDEGFRYITDEEIEKENIDAIVLSSYKFRIPIMERLRKDHAQIPFLDIYTEIEKAGIYLKSDYYYSGHPFHHYKLLNSLQNEYYEKPCEETIFQIVGEYIRIKDILSAICWTERYIEDYPKVTASALLEDLHELYELMLKGYNSINENNVIMLLFDGLRRRDFSMEAMPQIVGQVEKEWLYYENAYSYSTSTFESLLPVYSENTDHRTKYYEKNSIEESDCRFIQEAKKQNREIFFYTDIEHYVESADIIYSDTFLTLSEKLWQLLIDGVECKNGLFYIHSLYETHYSFCNPYTKGKIISEGTALLFDFLPQKGEKLRTDYVKQQRDALRYVDDITSPILSQISCSVLLFADHGNLVLKNDCRLEDVKKTKLLLDEEWIQIPMAVKAPRIIKGIVPGMHSLLEVPEIIIGLMNGSYQPNEKREIVKCGRSALYNPDFGFLYRKMGEEKYLLAFEGFIFADGYKLVVFSDGTMELFDVETDCTIEDEIKRAELYSRIKEYITVF